MSINNSKKATMQLSFLHYFAPGRVLSNFHVLSPTFNYPSDNVDGIPIDNSYVSEDWGTGMYPLRSTWLVS